MTPILNTMSVAGIVSIPGMMTGQLLARRPMQAVAYQIMIMFVIAASIALGTILVGARPIAKSLHPIIKLSGRIWCELGKTKLEINKGFEPIGYVEQEHPKA